MRSLTLCFVLFWMTMSAGSALAHAPKAGDIILNGDGTLGHIDIDTGTFHLISCWLAADCTYLGDGPVEWSAGSQDLEISPDGGAYILSGPSSHYRVDLLTGDRTLVATINVAPFLPGFFSYLNIYPVPSFFSPPTVASLGGWGLAVLIAGIAIGVQLRNRRTAET
jgi:hypothetical protein